MRRSVVVVLAGLLAVGCASEPPVAPSVAGSGEEMRWGVDYPVPEALVAQFMKSCEGPCGGGGGGGAGLTRGCSILKSATGSSSGTCYLKAGLATVITIGVPKACTSVTGCMAAVAGAAAAWTDYYTYPDSKDPWSTNPWMNFQSPFPG